MTTAGSISAVKQLIRATLLQNSDLTDKVDGRVYGAHFNDADAGTADYPLVILELQAGSRHSSGAFQTVIFEVWTYSRVSQGDALDLYDMVCNSLNFERMHSGSIAMNGSCRELNRPIEGWNEKARAWFAQGRFHAQVGGTA